MIYDRSVSVVEQNGKRITLAGLTFPLLLQNIFLTLYGTVSTIILSGYSAEAVSATSVVQQIIHTVITVIAMISQGVVIITSISLGVKQNARVASVTGAGIQLSVCGGAGRFCRPVYDRNESDRSSARYGHRIYAVYGVVFAAKRTAEFSE